MAPRRSPKSKNGVTPVYEDNVPVANKITLCPKTPWERTVLLEVPRGKEARRMTAKLLPLMASLDKLRSADASTVTLEQMVGLINEWWSNEEFEEVYLPFVLGLQYPDDADVLDNMTLMEAFEAFSTATAFILSWGQTEEAVEAQKK